MQFYWMDHRLIVLAMVAALLVASAIGHRLGARSVRASDSRLSLMSGIGVAMLGLLGLLLGFTLSMAIARYDARRDVIVSESNAIGTLWLRAGFLQEPLREKLRGALRDYTEARIVLGRFIAADDTLRAARSKSETLHASIWSVVERADRPEISNATLSSVIVAANELIDLHERTLASIENTLPARVFLLLLGVAALAMGFVFWAFGAASQRGFMAMLLLACLIGTVLMLIMDLSRPQRSSLDVATLERVRDMMTKADR